MKKFIDYFEEKVKRTVKDYDLVTKDDKVVVACSGGKDSTTTLYLLNKLGYAAEGMFVDLHIKNFSEINRENLKKFCSQHKIKLHVLSFRKEFGCSLCYIQSLLAKQKVKSCSVCGVLRRWLLNKKARELGATKLATGHNLDDEAQTILMNVSKHNPALSINFGPKTGVITDAKFVQRIKPLYFCLESESRKYSELMGFPVLYQRCPCGLPGYRTWFRNFLNELGDAAKREIVEEFLKTMPSLRERYRTDEKLAYCKVCGEPSRNPVCKACFWLKKLTLTKNE